MSMNPLVTRFLLPFADRAASDAYVKQAMEHFSLHGFGLWAIEIPGVCQFMGCTGLTHIRYQAHFTPAVEIAWRLDPAHWGHGYATEAAQLALTDGFGRVGLTEIVAVTAVGNQRSRRVMERLGMQRSAAEDFDHPRVPVDHPLRRHVLYRLSRVDWSRKVAAPTSL